MVISRQISTSSVYNGKHNFRKFLVLNKRGTRAFKEAQMTNPDPDVPVDSTYLSITFYIKLEIMFGNFFLKWDIKILVL